MDWVKRLSIGRGMGEPVEDQVVLGLNQVGWGVFDVQSSNFEELKLKAGCRFYVGRTDKFTVMLLQGTISKIEDVRPGIQRITVRQRSKALENDQSIRLSNCTALDVLEEIVELTGLTFATANPKGTGAEYLTTPVPEFSSSGALTKALDLLGKTYGVADAVWY